MEVMADLDTPGPSCSNRENLQAKQDNPQDDSRPVSGLLTSYHGVAYQVQWNMVVALEAKERWNDNEKAKSAFTFKIKDFKTEDPDAGKFDDIVSRCEIGSSGSAIEHRYEYDFHQLKSKLNTNEQVSFNELVKPKQQKEPIKKQEGVDKRPFALEKYFISYKDKIKKGEKYKDGRVGKLIIATNIDLDKDLKDNLFSPVKDVPMLDLIESETNKEPDVWKIDKVGPHYEKIVKQLQGTYDSVRLTNELVEGVLKNKVVTEKSLLSSYLFDLMQNEIIDKSGKLTQIFLENSEKLSLKAKEFRRLILKVGFEDKQPPISSDFKISKPDEFASEIALLINSSASANNKVRIERRKMVLKENIDKLANYVLVEDDDNKVKFSYIFWEKKENELPGNLGEFRKQLKCKLVHYSIVNQQDGPAVIAEKLQNYHFKVAKFSTCNEHLVDEKNFWKAMKDGVIKENIGAIFPSNNLLPTEKMEDMQNSIDEFFSKLRFIINYSQNDLDEFIKEKCIKFTGFVSDFVAYEFQVKIGNTLNLVSKDFISDSMQVDRFFQESQKQLESLTLIGLTLEYRAKSKLYGIEFSTKFVKDLLKLENESEHFLDSNKQIFNLITEQKDLTYIKFIQALEARGGYKNHGNYASLNLNSALLLQDLVLEAFQSERSTLLVIKCEPVEKNIKHLYYKLFIRLLDALNSKKSKKIILITQKDNSSQKEDDLGSQFRNWVPNKYEEKQDKQIGLVDLKKESQEKCLKERALIFQGKETTLGNLLFNGESKRLVNGEVLFDIIEGKRINIGSCMPSITDRNSPAYFKVMEVIDKHNLRDLKDDIFVISGIDRESLARKLKLDEDKIVLRSKDITFSEDKPFKFVVLGNENGDKNVSDFEDVCRQYQESPSTELLETQDKKLIHLIEFHDGNFIWNRYYDPKFYIDRYFDKILIDKNKFINYYIREKGGNICLVGKIQKDDFVNHYGIDEKQIASTLDELNKDKPIVILSDKEEEAQDTLKRLPPNCNFHWIQSNGKNFIWKRSNWEIETISEFQENGSSPEGCNGIYDSKLDDYNNFIWKHSNSEIETISEFQENGSSPEGYNGIYDSKLDDCNGIYENQLVNILKNERFVVIADIPGMGKSTTLLSLSKSYKKCNPLHWVIRINLKEYEDTIDVNLYNKFKKVTIGNIVKFLSEIDPEGLKHPFAKELLRHKLFTDLDSEILLLLDGFDEIRENSEFRQNKICKLLEFLKKNTSVKVVITTRRYVPEKIKLEKALSVLSHNFSPITDRQGQKYIKRVWQNCLKLVYNQNELNKSHLRTFVSVLYCKRYKAFGKGLSSFLGVPLQLQMLTQVYMKYLKVFEKNRKIKDETSVGEFLKDLDLSTLFRDFTARKYEIYFQEKNRFGKTVTTSDKGRLKKSYENDHKCLAYKYLFNKSPKSHDTFFGLFSSDKKQVSSKELKKLSKVGIILSQENDKFNFVHRAFAEYYVSELIFDVFQEKAVDPNYSQESKKKMWEFLLHHIFLHDNYYVIRNFINSTFSFRPLFEDFETNFVEHESLVHDLLKKTIGKREIFIQKFTIPLMHTNVLTPLEVAAFEGLSKIVEFILKIAPSNYIIDTHCPRICKINSSEHNVTAWEYAMRSCRLNVIKVLLKYAKKIDKCQYFLDVEYHQIKCRSIDSPLHHAVLWGSSEMVWCLVESGACTRSKVDTYEPTTSIYQQQMYQKWAGFTPLHCAFMATHFLNGSSGNDRLKKIQYLLKYGSDVNAKDEVGNTPLHLACVGCRDKSIDFLVRCPAGYFSISDISRVERFIFSLRLANFFQDVEVIEEMVKLLVTESQCLQQIFPKDRGMSMSNFINAVNSQGFTPIFLAAASGLYKIVSYLMGNVDCIDISRNSYGATTLHFLAMDVTVDLTNIMEDFIRKSGVDVNVKTTEPAFAIPDVLDVFLAVGETPLHWAAKSDNVEAVKVLLGSGVDKNAKNQKGRTALDLCKNPTIIRLLKRWMR